MKEKDLYTKFAYKIKQHDPSSFWYKIPDTKGLGGCRPFDGILVCGGRAFAIEFKGEKTPVTRYQEWSLEKFRIAGGTSLIFRAGMNMDKFIKKIQRIAYAN